MGIRPRRPCESTLAIVGSTPAARLIRIKLCVCPDMTLSSEFRSSALIGEMDRSSYRIAVGLFVAALTIGSSLIILAGTGPTLWRMPVFGLVGFTTAFLDKHIGRSLP